MSITNKGNNKSSPKTVTFNGTKTKARQKTKATEKPKAGTLIRKEDPAAKRARVLTQMGGSAKHFLSLQPKQLLIMSVTPPISVPTR